MCSLKKDLSPEINELLLSSGQGNTLMLEGVDLRGLPTLEYDKVVQPGPKHIISDDPEYIAEHEGMVLQEPLEPGSYRFYLYNVNGVVEPEKIPRKISVVVENQGEDTMTVKFSHKAFWKPSDNYHAVAQETLHQYFSQEVNPPTIDALTIPAGGAAPLDMDVENAVAQFNELVHCLHEFSVDQPGRISVVQTAPDTPSVEALKRIDTAIKSHRETAGRGTFDISGYDVSLKDNGTFDTAMGSHQLILADGKTDPWVKGKDNSNGEDLELAGNYGVMYDISIPWKSTDSRGLAVCSYNSVFKGPWCNGTSMSGIVNEGLYEGGAVKLPGNKLRFDGIPEVVVLQVYAPLGEGENGQVEVTYSPPGAACLPIPLVLIPIDFIGAEQTDSETDHDSME